jgi:hypothetical protein
VPQAIAEIAAQNKAVVYGILFRATANTLRTFGYPSPAFMSLICLHLDQLDQLLPVGYDGPWPR